MLSQQVFERLPCAFCSLDTGFPWSFDAVLVDAATVSSIPHRSDWSDTGGAEMLRRRVVKEGSEDPADVNGYGWKWVRTNNACEKYNYPSLNITCDTGNEFHFS